MNAILQMIDRPREDDAMVASFLLGRPATTQRVYKSEIRLFKEFMSKPFRLAQAEDLRGYVEKCRRSGLRPATLRHKIATIKALFSFLFQEGSLPADPMVRVPTPPQPNADSSRNLSTAQVRAFFRVIPSHRLIGLRDQGLFLVAAAAGLRLSELSRLSIGDIREGDEKGWMRARVLGKGDRTRTIDVRAEVWGAVQSYLRRRKDELSPEAPLFTSIKRRNSIRPQATDLRIPPCTIYRRFKLLASRAGLPDWASPHGLRHHFAAEAHRAGTPAEAIRRALGHTSLSTTQRYLTALQDGPNPAFAAVKIRVEAEA